MEGGGADALIRGDIVCPPLARADVSTNMQLTCWVAASAVMPQRRFVQAQDLLKAAGSALTALGSTAAAVAAIKPEAGDRVELVRPAELEQPAHLDNEATELLRAQAESGPLARAGAAGTVVRIIRGASGAEDEGGQLYLSCC